MKVGIFAAVAVVAAACSSGSHPAPKPQSASERFVSAARHLTSSDLYVGIDDATLLQDGRAICADVRAHRLVNGQPVAASNLVANSSFTWAQAAGLTKVARATLCRA